MRRQCQADGVERCIEPSLEIGRDRQSDSGSDLFRMKRMTAQQAADFDTGQTEKAGQMHIEAEAETGNTNPDRSLCGHTITHRIPTKKASVRILRDKILYGSQDTAAIALNASIQLSPVRQMDIGGLGRALGEERRSYSIYFAKLTIPMRYPHTARYSGCRSRRGDCALTFKL